MDRDAILVVGATVATAATSGIDLGVLALTASVVAVAIIAGVASYAAAIRQARAEIKTAFDEHLAHLHAEHQKIVVGLSDAANED